MSTFVCVAALDEEGGIGKDGGLAWRLKADMQYFKNLTTAVVSPQQQNAVIMGRLTWESIPRKFRPLENRINLVLTSDPEWEDAGAIAAESLEDALAELAEYPNLAQIFVIGGGRVYKEALAHPDCIQLYLTHIDGSYDCDTFFPDFLEDFNVEATSEAQEEDGMRFIYAVYSRKSDDEAE